MQPGLIIGSGEETLRIVPDPASSNSPALFWFRKVMYSSTGL